MATRMLQRRGTAAEWAAENPILASGEMGFETDTKIIKMGDGVTPWLDLSLPYVSTGGGTMTGALNLIAPTADAHAARKIDVDNASFEVFESWLAENRGTGIAEASPVAHAGVLTIPNPNRTVKIFALQAGSISKGPAVGVPLEIDWEIQISLDGGSSWSNDLEDVSSRIDNASMNNGGGCAAVGFLGGTPSGNIVVRLLTQRKDSQSGVVNANAQGGYVRVIPA